MRSLHNRDTINFKIFNGFFVLLLIILIVHLKIFATALSEQKTPKLAIQIGHTGSIVDLIWSPDSQYVATLGSINDQDGTVKIWHAETGQLVADLGFSTFTAFAWSPDGKKIAVADKQMDEILIWDTFKGKFKTTLKEVPEVHSMSWSPDGKYLAAHTNQGVQIWITENWKLKNKLEETRGAWGPISWSPNGKFMITASLVWEMPAVDAWAKLENYKPDWSGEQPTAWSPDGQYFAAGNEKVLKIWDLNTGHLVFKKENRQEILSLAWSSDGQFLVIGSFRLQVWKVKHCGTNKQKTLDIQLFKELTGHKSWIQSIRWSPDGKYLASGSKDGSAQIWDTKKWERISTLKGHKREITAMHWSPDGKKLATASTDRTARVWNPIYGQTISELKALVGSQNVVSWSPDGKLLAMGGDNNPVRIWDVKNGQVITALRTPKRINKTIVQVWKIPASAGVLKRPVPESNVRSISWSPDGEQIAVVTTNGSDLLEIWECKTGKLKKRWKSVPMRIAWSPDGKYLAIAIKSRKEGDPATRLFDVSKGRFEVGADLQVKGKETVSVTSLSWSPDGRYLARGGTNIASGVWDIKKKQIVPPFVCGTITAWSPDGHFLAIDTKIWDIKRKAFVVELQRELKGTKFQASFPRLFLKFLLKFEWKLSCLAFSPDSKYLAGGTEWVARIWDRSTGKQTNILAGHRGDVTQVSWSPDGTFLFTSSNDGSIKMWKIPEGKLLATLITVGEEKDWLVTTPKGLFDGSPTAWKLIGWHNDPFNFLNIDPVEIYFNDFFYPNLLGDILAGLDPMPQRDILRLDRRQPRIKITSPNIKTTQPNVSTRNIAVHIEVTEALPNKTWEMGSGAYDLRLFRNGSLIKVWRGMILPSNQKSVVLKTTIPVVAGENLITAYAFNRDNVKSKDANMLVIGDEVLKRKGKMYIFTVGVNEYANAEYNLKFAETDAKIFAKNLKIQQENLNYSGYVEIVSLFNNEATKSNILEVLSKLAGEKTTSHINTWDNIKQAQPEDVLFIYFAGHGTTHRSRFYLIPYDIGYNGFRRNLERSGFKTILDSSISDRELEKIFEKIDVSKLVLVIDACNSGQALETRDRRRGPMNSKGLAQLAYEKGMYVLTASQGYQAALEAGQLGHGLLTYALIKEGLKSTLADSSPEDGKIVIREWMDFASLRVPQIQIKMMEEAQKRGKYLTFADWERDILDLKKRSLQRPRVFYRREPEKKLFVIAIPKND
jgi:WD40 repeat protein